MDMCGLKGLGLRVVATTPPKAFTFGACGYANRFFQVHGEDLQVWRLSGFSGPRVQCYPTP